MTEERITNLALIHIHYETSVELEEVVQMFAERNSRRLELINSVSVFIHDVYIA